MKKNFFKRISALTLSAMMLFSVSAVAFADEGATPNTDTMGITKELQMPEGSKTPNATFQFTFTYDGMKTKADADTLDTTASYAPAITVADFTFTDADEGTTAEGVKSVVKVSDDILTGLNANDFAKPGYYYYTVKETADTYTAQDGEQVDYSKAEYQIVLSVFTDGMTKKLKVAGGAVISKVNDAGTAVAEAKVDGTVSDATAATGNGFRFVNKFTRSATLNPTSDNPNPGTGMPATGQLDNLWIGKTVSGELGDLTYFFPFKVKVTNPVLTTSNIETTYKAYIMTKTETGWDYVTVEDDAKKVSDAAAKDDSGDLAGKYYVTVTSGTEATVNLKHNMALCVTKLPVGAKFQATETYADTDYTTTCKLIVNGTEQTGKTTDTAEQLIGEDTNTSFFNNDKQASILTGILVDNLPYITMIVLAAFAFALYVIMKVRKARKGAC